MGFSAVSPALCTHLHLPPCWVCRMPPSRGTSVTRHLKWEVATFGYILNQDRLSFAWWLQMLPPDVAREKAEGHSGAGPDASSARSCCTCCFLASPAAPAPRNSCSVGSVHESLAKKAERKLSNVIWQRSLPLQTQVWKVVLRSAHKLHPRLLSCGALERGGFSQHKTTALGWGLKSWVSNEEIKPGKFIHIANCIKPSDNQSLFLCFEKK